MCGFIPRAARPHRRQQGTLYSLSMVVRRSLLPSLSKPAQVARRHTWPAARQARRLTDEEPAGHTLGAPGAWARRIVQRCGERIRVAVLGRRLFQ